MTNKTPLALLAAGLALLAQGACAQDAAAPRSLNDARQGLRSGTAPGIVIWEPKRREPSAQAPAAAASGASAGTAAKAQAEPPATGSGLQRMFSAIREHSPPSGQSLNSAKTLNAPSNGIPVPTAPPASAAR